MKFSLFDVIQEAKAFGGSLQGESKGKAGLKKIIATCLWRKLLQLTRMEKFYPSEEKTNKQTMQKTMS